LGSYTQSVNANATHKHEGVKSRGGRGLLIVAAVKPLTEPVLINLNDPPSTKIRTIRISSLATTASPYKTSNLNA
jgi:hypothetical protein